ncbi:MAG: tyrosine-protein phosphatase [Erysipelotrichaceae bacterium]
MITKFYRRLPLENLYNARDLGGYLINNKQSTKWYRFLRTDNLHHATEKDKQYLKSYGVRTVLDLRSDSELVSNPNPFKEDKQVKYFHCPLIVGDATSLSNEQLSEALKHPNPLGKLYLSILQNGQSVIKDIFEIIAKEQQTVLYHCTAGKDRTGVVSALLLGLADVSRADIINNYIETYYYLMESPFINKSYKKESKASQEIKDKFMNSNPINIEMALDYLDKEYGSIEKYLLSCGIEAKTLNIIKESFCESEV